MVDLSVRIGRLALANPVMPASGAFSDELARVFDLSVLGALVTKTITRELRVGNPTPRVAETPSGMLNSIGIPSKGFAYFRDRIVPAYDGIDRPLVASISAGTVDAFVRLCADVAAIPRVAVIEANISCPNLEEDGRAFAMRPETTRAAIEGMVRAVDKPVWAKLTPNTGEIAEVARAAEAGGAEAVVVANTILGMKVDTETWRPALGNIMGGLSGPAVRPVIVRMAYQCANAVRIPVIGCGGIATAEDAVEFLLAGCTAVQVGTATFLHPGVMARIIDDLAAYCRRKGLDAVRDLVGAIRLPEGAAEDLTARIH